HFASHGILGLEAGRQPSLVLSLVGNGGQADEGGTNDGYLQLDEVMRLRLNADLVVLSACETGRGRLYDGEGVRGLARAFLHAGSRGGVCSLWRRGGAGGPEGGGVPAAAGGGAGGRRAVGGQAGVGPSRQAAPVLGAVRPGRRVSRAAGCRGVRLRGQQPWLGEGVASPSP